MERNTNIISANALDDSFEYEPRRDVLSDAPESRRVLRETPEPRRVEPTLSSSPRLQPVLSGATEFRLRGGPLSFERKISTFKPALLRFQNQLSWFLTVIEDKNGIMGEYPRFLTASQANVSILDKIMILSCCMKSYACVHMHHTTLLAVYF